MSYDIRFAVKVADAPEGTFAVIDEPRVYSNPTYNLRDMFVACMDWNYKQGKWYKITEVLPKVQRGITELTMHRKKYLKYNPPNGWGDVDGALKALKAIVEYFSDSFDGLRGTWNADVPVECIYMSW